MSELINGADASLLSHYLQGPFIFDAMSVLADVHRLADRGLLVASDHNGIKHELTEAGRTALWDYTKAQAEVPSGNFAIKVDGEEIDHADTRAEARRNRDTIIYGEIGTEANTTIEPRAEGEGQRLHRALQQGIDDYYGRS